jgi:AraC-like DNA-binding protein
VAQRTKTSEKGHLKVKSVIAGLALAGTVSLETAARHLGTSPRTLQRNLTKSGISFWALVEQSRFEIAIALLCDTDLKVQEIATRLGYSSPGGFSRAFARWAGCSPSDFRNTPAERRYGSMARNGQKSCVRTGNLNDR